MTKEEVNQLYYINKEISMWQRELQKIRNQSFIKGQQITGVPFNSGISNSIADKIIKVLDIEEKIQELENKASEERIKILKFIESIENSCDRQIIFLRAAKCMPWRKIAYEIGGDNTEDSIRQRYNRLFIRKTISAK